MNWDRRDGKDKSDEAGTVRTSGWSHPVQLVPESELGAYRARCNDRITQFLSGPLPLTPSEREARQDGAVSGVHAAAERGIAGPSTGLPHGEQIQAAFGPHDISGVRAHVGGAAAEACGAMGASAYATGSQVAFAGQPDLHTASHEAAHVVQQRQGVQLYGGVGEVGDVYERQADAVADAVVAGKSAAGLLGDAFRGGSNLRVVQCFNGLAIPQASQPRPAAASQASREVDESTVTEPTLATVETEYMRSGAETLSPTHFRIWGFVTGSTVPPVGASAVLDTLASLAAADRHGTLRIVGYASSSGTERKNESLSEERAYRILEALVERGVAKDRIVAQGEGETAPLLDENDDPARMARNRRVDVFFDGVMGTGSTAQPAPKQHPVHCDSYAEAARWDRVMYKAWSYYLMDNGMGASTGIRDRGVGDDGVSFKPSRRNVQWAAGEYGYRSDHDVQAFVEMLVPMTPNNNLHAHMMDYLRSAERLEAMAKSQTSCSPGRAELKLTTLEDVRGKQKGPSNLFLENTTAPNGARR